MNHIIKNSISLFFILLCCKICSGQANHIENLKDEQTSLNNGELKPIIIGDERITKLLNTKRTQDESEPTIEGYRIQIFFASGNNSRKMVSDKRTEFLIRYPQIGAYEIWQSPNFKVRVGDFRTKLEAYKFYKEIKGEFPSSFIVKDNIALPKLD
jgi:hypothetical protein